MNIVTKEMLSDLIGVAKTASTEISAQVVDIVNQALNYALFEAVLNLISILALYLIYYIIAKILTAAQTANELENTEAGKKTANVISLGKQLLFIVFTGVVLYNAQSSVRAIGKIMISPKVYLLEEGAKVLNNIKK